MKFDNLKKYCIWIDLNFKSFTFKRHIEKSDYKLQLLEKTKFLPEEITVSARVYCILHNITEQPKCECGNNLKFIQYSEGFREFCSVKCSSNSISKQEKISNTNIKKYGHKNAFHSEAGRKGHKVYVSDKLRISKAYYKGLETKIKKNNVTTPAELFTLIIQKTQQTKLIKYGNKNFNNAQKAILSRDGKQMYKRLQDTMLLIYGYDSFSKTPLERQQLSERMINRHQNGFTLTQKKIMQERYGVDSPLQYAPFYEKRSKNFGWKDYILPNKQIIKLQGYEPWAFDELLLVYSFKDILYSKIDVPEIWYYYGDKNHRYYPDFFIPIDNLIVEVKSSYTMLKDFYINMLKAQACKKMGYIFKFYIYDDNGVRFK